MRKVIVLLLVCSGLHAQQWTTTPPDWFTIDNEGQLVEKACLLHESLTKQTGLSWWDDTVWLTHHAPFEAVKLMNDAKVDGVFLVIENGKSIFFVFRFESGYIRTLIMKDWLK